jgi:hypothetical protein
MAKSKEQPYGTALEKLMAEKTKVLSQAQAFSEMRLASTARPLWLAAATLEERIAPLLDAIDRDREAAVHRVSAASCYEKAGDLSRAANLYQAALAGPLRDASRSKVEQLLKSCLAGLMVSPSTFSAVVM